MTQQFSYNAHNVLASGLGESETYDLNGNLLTQTLNGSTSTRTFDDEDRLTSITIPGVGTDTFTYNGLGLRVGKADSTGTFSFLCDGASPASPVLWDGYAVYTPGLSENRGGTTLYNHADLLGSLVELTDSQQQPTNAAEYDGFGSITSSWLGQNQVPSVTPFKFGGGNGCQSDADTGLVLMGHRYYDPRTGRFLSQDPAGDGDNWYQYAGNNPTNETDPTGLFKSTGMGWGDIYNEAAAEGGPGSYWETKDQNNHVIDSFFVSNPDMGIGTPGSGMGMFAGDHHTADGSKWYKSKSGDHDPPHVHRGIDGPRYNREGKEVKPNGELKPGGGSVKKSQMDKFRKVFDELNPRRPGAAAAAEEVAVDAEVGLDLAGPVGMFIGAGIAAWDIYNNPEHGQGTLTWTGPDDPRASR